MQIRGHGAKLPRKQEEAITALLTCKSVDDAAKHIGVAPSTMFRWLQDKGFSAAYRKAKSNCVAHTISRLQQITIEAVEVLEAIMLDTQKPANTRTTAARTVIDMAFKGFELDDLAQRITELEEEVAKKNGH